MLVIFISVAFWKKLQVKFSEYSTNFSGKMNICSSVLIYIHSCKCVLPTLQMVDFLPAAVFS